MKNSAFIIVLLLLFLPIALKAQWKRETGFSLGIIRPAYDKDRFYYGEPGAMFKVGTTQSWLQQDKKVSVRPEIGLSTEILSLDLTNGGKATNSTMQGNIFSFNGELALMAQFQILPFTKICIGPSGKFLLTGITNVTTDFDGGILYPNTHTHKEYKGFNRKFLNEPSLGIKVMLNQKNLNEKINMGAIFNYQWEKAEDDYFYFSRTAEITFYLGLN
ncbi:MAG: hypothetical protein Q8N05_14485 [Bacteroidota bacterium]|nr:hypothetical protein [Bacteroidota bacterium]